MKVLPTVGDSPPGKDEKSTHGGLRSSRTLLRIVAGHNHTPALECTVLV